MPTETSIARTLPGWSSVLAGFAALLLLVFATGCGGSDAKGQQPQGPPPVPVKIQVTKAVPIKDTSEYVATLKSRETAVIMPQVEGYITEIYVRSGEHVAAGAPIMQIDPSKQQAAVKSQEDAHAAQVANVQWAQVQYDRISKLYQAGVSSKQEYDQAKTALDAARAQLHALEAQVHEQRVQLHYYKVIAPRNGIVGDIPVRVGDRVITSTMLTTVDKPGTLEAYIYVPVEKAPRLHMKDPVQIVDGAGNVLADSRISFISPQVDNTTQTVLVKATIANNQDNLRNSQFIRARVVWSTRDTPTVPVISVSRIGGQYFVFVAEDQNGKLVAHQKPLQIGEIVGNDYVVQGGIKPGDKVIVSGTQFLVDGAPVAPENGGAGL